MMTTGISADRSEKPSEVVSLSQRCLLPAMHNIGQSIKSPECPSVCPCVLLFLSYLHSTFSYLPLSFPLLLSLSLPFSPFPSSFPFLLTFSIPFSFPFRFPFPFPFPLSFFSFPFPFPFPFSFRFPFPLASFFPFLFPLPLFLPIFLPLFLSFSFSFSLTFPLSLFLFSPFHFPSLSFTFHSFSPFSFPSFFLSLFSLPFPLPLSFSLLPSFFTCPRPCVQYLRCHISVTVSDKRMVTMDLF